MRNAIIGATLYCTTGLIIGCASALAILWLMRLLSLSLAQLPPL